MELDSKDRYKAVFHSSIDQFTASEWNSLCVENNPFIRHEFLAALEHNGCVGETFGWYPHHLKVTDFNRNVIAASPLYIKSNSYGEFVFDWSWASAYEQAGIPYYPKLVCSSPYNPVTGNRLLIHPGKHAHASRIRRFMINAIVEEANHLQLSGIHWLFTEQDEQKDLVEYGLMQRLGCQYHWHNHNYASFDEFLSGFSSRKRKKVKRERRRVQEQEIDIQVLHGNQIEPGLWPVIHAFYTSTFDRKSGIPTLTLPFFQEISQTMGESIVIMLAMHHDNPVACSICLRSDNALFGRFWGCREEFHSLHFETCFYQGIDYCIQHGLAHFEPGAQGEHKIARGFLPVKTWSAHWIAHNQFRTILSNFCLREMQMMEVECEELAQLSPYRKAD